MDSPFSNANKVLISIAAIVGVLFGTLYASQMSWFGYHGSGLLHFVIFGTFVTFGALRCDEELLNTQYGIFARTLFLGILVSIILVRFLGMPQLLGGIIAFPISYCLAPRIV